MLLVWLRKAPSASQSCTAMCGAFGPVVSRTPCSFASSRQGSLFSQCFMPAEIQLSGRAAYNKQLQRTVRDKVPRHIDQRAAAELRRYAQYGAHRTSIRDLRCAVPYANAKLVGLAVRFNRV